MSSQPSVQEQLMGKVIEIDGEQVRCDKVILPLNAACFVINDLYILSFQKAFEIVGPLPKGLHLVDSNE